MTANVTQGAAFAGTSHAVPVRRGSFILSQAFDLTGELKPGSEGSILFGDIERWLEAGHVRIVKLSQSATTEVSNRLGIPEQKNYSDDDFQRRSREFQANGLGGQAGSRSGSTVSSTIDDLLVCLFRQRQVLLTGSEQGRFCHIKLPDLHAVLHISGTIHGSVDGAYRGKTFRAVIRPYLMINLDRRAGSVSAVENAPVSQVAVLTGVVDLEDVDPPGDRTSVEREAVFIEHVHRMAVDLDATQELSENGQLLDFVPRLYSQLEAKTGGRVEPADYSTNTFIEKDQVGQTKHSIGLYNFMVAISWYWVVERVRIGILRNRSSRVARSSYAARFCSYKLFSEQQFDMRNYVSFETKFAWAEVPVYIKHFHGSAAEMLARHPEWVSFLMEIAGGHQSEDHRNRTLNLFSAQAAVNFTTHYSSIFANRLINFFDPGLGQESTAEVAWYVLLSEMLCTTAQTFLLYDSRIERSLQTRRGGLGELLLKAYTDFAEYYDVGVIASYHYAREYEVCRKAMKLDSYHDTLEERIRVYSDHDLSVRNLRLVTAVVLVSIAAAVLSLASVLPDPYREGLLITTFVVLVAVGFVLLARQ